MPNPIELTVESNKELSCLNTLSVPSRSKYFCEIKAQSQLLGLIDYIKKNALPLVILGGGSNVLLPDNLSGLVAKISTKEKRLIEDNKDDVLIRFAAGEDWHSLVMWSVEQGYYGLENLALIPGNIGAAPIQNIGAYGVELDQVCEYVEVIDIDSAKQEKLSRSQCQFAYRDSIFKRELKDKVIITHVALRLKKIKDFNINYPALKQALNDNKKPKDKLTSLDVANAVIAIRQSKLPDPKCIPNAGSFFKNPLVSNEKLAILLKEFPNIVSYPMDESTSKLAAGWLIDQAGWKGRVVDGISMHQEQALVLTNPHSASAQRLLDFSQGVVDSIKQKFDVILEIEPRVYS